MFQKPAECGVKRGLDLESLTGRQLETKPKRVQEQSTKPERSHPLVEITVSVFVIAGNRVPRYLGMNPDLVGSTRKWLGLYKSGIRELSQDSEAGLRCLARIVGTHNALPGTDGVLFQRRRDAGSLGRPVAHDESQIRFGDSTFPQARMQVSQERALLGNHHTARGVPIEAMDQFKGRTIRPHGPQRLDQTKTETTAAVNGKPGRLVDNQQPFVLENDAFSELLTE